MAIETGFKYSIAELRELKNQHKGEFKTGFVRPVPNQILLTARVLGQNKAGELRDVLDYFNGAFHLYRSCVGGDPTAGIPMVRYGGVYEWPKPIEFSWVEMEKVSIVGKLMRGPVSSGIRVRTPSNELERVVMEMEKTFAFSIPSLDKVGFIQDGMEWQQELLKVFNPLAGLSEDLRLGNMNEIEARSRLFLALGQLTKLQQENLQILN